MYRNKKTAYDEHSLSHGNKIFQNYGEGEESFDSNDIYFIRVSSAFSVLFGLFLFWFLIWSNYHLLAGEFFFLYTSVLYFVIELTMFITFCYKFRQTSPIINLKNFRKFIKLFILVLCCIYVMAVLFGAELSSNITATFVFSYHLTTFLLVPFYFNSGDRCLRIIIAEESPRTPIEWSYLFSSAGSAAGAWFGAFVIPLDWDRDWQEWPISCTMATILGFVAGNLFSFCSTFVNSHYLRGKFYTLK